MSNPNSTESFVRCPHCLHKFDKDDMDSCSVDLLDLAHSEGTAEIECPICDQEFVVRGGYTPHYSSAFAQELLDHDL